MPLRAVALAGLLALLAAFPVAAQDAAGPLAANVYAGGCDAPAPPPVAGFSGATPEAGPADYAASTFATTVDSSLMDLLAEPHAIVVERTDGELLTTVACGEIAGDAAADRLVIGLFAPDGGGLAGVAVVTANDEGGTSIVVFTVLGAGGEPVAPVGGPADAEDQGDGVLDEPQEPSDEQDGVEGGV